MKLRYIFISLEIVDGEKTYYNTTVIATKAMNLEFAANWYAAHFFGESESERSQNDVKWWDEFMERLVSVSSWKEITESEFNVLNKYI